MMAKQIGMKSSDPKYARLDPLFLLGNTSALYQSVFSMQTQWASPIHPLFYGRVQPQCRMQRHHTPV